MSVITEKHREILEKSEWLAIATQGESGAHVVGTWCDYPIYIDGATFLIPIGGFVRTGKNIEENSRVELLCGTRAVMGTNGPGKGLCIRGTAEMQYEGGFADMIKAKFVWARGAMVIRAEKATTQL